MRLETLRAHNMGPFTDVEIDLTAIAGKVVAITGQNGAGKTSLLELYAGILHRSMPTRGSLASIAKNRGSYVEARVVNGAAWTIRHSLDPISGKADVLVLDDQGQPALPSAQRRAFDTWAASHLPSQEVFFSSVFSAQGKGGFLALSTGERKAVVLRLLGIERLELLAERAREQQRETRARHVAAAAHVTRSRATFPLDEARRILTEEETLLRGREDIVGLAELSVARADRVAGQLERAREAENAIGAAARRVTELEEQTVDLTARIANNRKLLADGPRVAAARVRASELDGLLVAARGQVERRTEYREHALSDLRLTEARLEGATAAAKFCDDQVRKAEQAVADGRRAREAETELGKVHAAIAEAETELAAAHATLDGLGQEHVAGAEDRIVGLRGALIEIGTPCCDADGDRQSPGEYYEGVATGALAADDTAVELAATMPARLDLAKARVRQTRAEVDGLRDRDRRLTPLARGAAAAEEAERSLPALREARATADAALPAARTAHGLAGKTLSTARVASADALAAVTALEGERAALEPTLKLEAPLAAAGARIAELSQQLDGVTEQLAKARADRAALPTPIYPEHETTVEAAKAQLAQAKADEKAARDGVAEARYALQVSEEHAARLVELEAEVVAIEVELQDWVLLADSLGREGLQAILIDAAGPEIEALTNDLLHQAFGPRFTVTFETTKLAADGKRELEVFDIRVLDTKEGREGPVEDLSGGEKAIVGEAVALALTTVACRRSGLRGVTLIRDETGAALDEENGPRYVAMLRRAADLVGASHVLFVAHNKAMQDLADARIHIKDRRVTVLS